MANRPPYPFVHDGLEGLTGELHMWHWGGLVALVRAVSPSRFAAIAPMANSWMLFTGATALGGEYYDNRWIYESRTSAVEGLSRWGGEGDPPRWSFHPRTRRWNPNLFRSTPTRL